MMLMPLIATIGKALTLLIIMVLVKALTGEGNISLDKFLISSFAELLMNTIFAPLIYLILNLIVKKDRKSYL